MQLGLGASKGAFMVSFKEIGEGSAKSASEGAPPLALLAEPSPIFLKLTMKAPLHAPKFFSNNLLTKPAVYEQKEKKLHIQNEERPPKPI